MKTHEQWKANEGRENKEIDGGWLSLPIQNYQINSSTNKLNGYHKIGFRML